jgi:hypothetical protein
MKKNSALGLADLDPAARKEKLEAHLQQLEDAAQEQGEPEISASDRRKRFYLSLNILVFCAILGSTTILASSLWFFFIPAPLIYATTQDGRIIELQPQHK